MTPESLSIQFAAPVKVTDPAECDFYHRMDVPGLGQVGGAWDLRDCINAYLGNYDFNGKRVLDVGTASGFLTFSMENEGAEVVSFDMVSGGQWDVVPQKKYRVDPQSYMALLVEADRRLKNAYWFTHERVGSKAKAFYGDVYNLPEALGPFDVAVFGMIITHLRDAFRALYSASRLVRGDLIITRSHLINRRRPPKSSSWWLARRERRAYPHGSVRNEQRRQTPGSAFALGWRRFLALVS